MFEHPYFLGLFALAGLLLLWRHSRYYLKHPYLTSVRSAGGVSIWRRIEWLCNCVGWLFLVLASANILLGYKEVTKKQAIHKYVLVNDASGSMVSMDHERGAGQQIMAVEAGNAAFLKLLSSRTDGSKDLVGATVFDHESYVVSYLVDDPEFVRQKLVNINYNAPPLGGGTQLDKALWGAMEVVLNDGEERSTELQTIASRLYNSGELESDAIMEGFVSKYLPRSTGASLVIFTDGDFANPNGHVAQMSAYKLLTLCEALKIRVYMISIMNMNSSVLKAIKATGGDGIVCNDFDKNEFEQIYQDIVSSQAQEMVVVEQDAKKSLGTICGLIAGILLATGLIISQTINRKYTEV